jgi:(S)-3,5-dihydroxyphenylglycine transaminase
MSAVVAEKASRLDVMNFLNEIAIDYPDAISFASGRPAEAFFALDQWIGRIQDFVEHFARERGIDVATAYNLLAQYGRTNGVINALIAQQVGNDEGIACSAERIIATAGCQEAIALCVSGLFASRDEVLLVRSPTYIGATGIADLSGVELAAVSCDDPDGFASELRRVGARLAAQGKKARALYLIPEFDNPTGTVLSRGTRAELVELCADHGIVILEDNPYGMFRFEGERIPPLFALDQRGCVIYLGTYSKTLCPSLRVGFMIVPPKLFGDAARADALLEPLSKVKSFVTVNTSQIMQALVGGMLLAENGTLARVVQPALDFYRGNRDAMIESLDAEFAGYHHKVSWNRPNGGFFLTVSLPFEFGREEVERCASDYQVLTMPLSFFALDDGHDRCVRLAFSNQSQDRIRTGVRRFARFVKDRLARS